MAENDKFSMAFYKVKFMLSWFAYNWLLNM